MPIVFDKLKKILKDRNITVYRLKKDQVIKSSKMVDQLFYGNSRIGLKSIEDFCRYLGCQPGDLMEYVEDTEEEHDT